MYTSKTTNSQYDGKWISQGSHFLNGKSIPPISEVLGRQKTKIPIINKDANRIHENAPLKTQVKCASFPVEFPEQLRYPCIDKKGADNPIYFASSYEIGCRPPDESEIPDRYYPKTNWFSQSFADRTFPSAGLNTAPCKSQVHSSLDETY